MLATCNGGGINKVKKEKPNFISGRQMELRAGVTRAEAHGGLVTEDGGSLSRRLSYRGERLTHGGFGVRRLTYATQ